MLRSISLAAFALTLSPPSFAQEAPPKEEGETPAQPAASVDDKNADAAAPEAQEAEQDGAAQEIAEEDPRIAELRQKKDKALLGYTVGNVDAALSNLRVLIAACDDLEEEVCHKKLRAELYVALAIVLAGGKNDIRGAARLFHAALSFDPDVLVPRELATTPVQHAMFEANRSMSFKGVEEGPAERHAPRRNARAPLAKDWGTDDGLVEKKTAPPKKKDKKGLLLLNAQAGAGELGTHAVPHAGVGLSLGVRPTPSPWVMALRGRASGLGYAPGGGSSLVGFSLLSGAVFGKDTSSNTFAYVMGGLGVDSYQEQPAINTQANVGVSLGGFVIGAGAEAGGGYGSYTLLSLHLGWGRRI